MPDVYGQDRDAAAVAQNAAGVSGPIHQSHDHSVGQRTRRPHLYVETWILAAPTAEDQMMLAKTAAEEIDHHRKFVKILADLNIDVSYQIKNRREK